MHVEIIDDAESGRSALLLSRVRIDSFTEHDLRDLEFVLAQRRAMSRRCGAELDEHTCGLAPHDGEIAAHVCRGCTRTWLDIPVPEREG